MRLQTALLSARAHLETWRTRCVSACREWWDGVTPNRVLAFALVLAIGVFFAGHIAHAEDGTDPWAWIINKIGELMALVISFLGNLVILMAEVVINFAGYNDFANAQPVVIGWVLMRDIANMFFIVVLLVSAFSTIIGYDEFHYSKVLKKLLLMAVLINFSKLAIGLMIDLSQVVMLTFVNAFRQAAGGNFVTAFKLSEIFKIVKNPDDNPYKTANLFISAMLAITMLGISLTVLVIMAAYLVARIVGLWLILIMSPLAFLATALPGKISKVLDQFTGKFWSRLTAMLVGGPMMAFFLWLALAVVQQSKDGQPFGNIFTATDESSGVQTSFSTAIGQVGDIATFIVAVAILLAGVESAVTYANQISSSLGKFAKTVSADGGIAAQLARGTARLAGRAVKTTAKVGFEGVDRVADIRGKIGRQGLALSSKLGGVGAESFAGMAGYRAKSISDKERKMTSLLKGVDTASRDNYLRNMSSSIDPHKAEAATMSLARMAISPSARKARVEAAEKDMKKMPNLQNLSAAELRAHAEVLIDNQLREDAKKGISLAEMNGDDDLEKDIKEGLKKNPALYSDLKKLAEIKTSRGDQPDIKKHVNKSTAETWASTAPAAAFLSSMGLRGFKRVNGEVVPDADDDFEDGVKQIQRTKGAKAAFFQQQMEFFKNEYSQGRDTFNDTLAAIDGDADAEKRMRAVEMRFAKGEDGSVGGFRVADMKFDAPITQNIAVQKPELRNEAGVQRGLEALKQMKNTNPSMRATDQSAMAVKAEMMTNGARLGEAFKLDVKKGTFAGADDREAFAGFTKALDTSLQQPGDQMSMEVLMRFDTEALKSNAQGINEARSEFVSNVSKEALESGYRKAIDAGNDAAKEQIQQLLRVFSTEQKSITDRLDQALKAGTISKDDHQLTLDYTRGKIIEAADMSRAVDAVGRVQGAGIVDDRDIKSMMNAAQIDSDPQMRAIRSTVSDRASAAAASAVASVRTTATRAAASAQQMGRDVGDAANVAVNQAQQEFNSFRSQRQARRDAKSRVNDVRHDRL